MAVASSPVAAPAAAPAQKKTRKNPARRRAQRAQSCLEQPKVATTNIKTETPKPQPGRQSQPARTRSSPSVLTLRQTTKPATPPTPSTTQVHQPATAKSQTTALARTIRPRQLPTPDNQNNSLALTAPAILTGGLLGCAASAALLTTTTLWHDHTNAQAAITNTRAARLCFDSLSDELIGSLQSGVYNTDEALDMLRRTTLAYAGAVPGGAPMVERVFREVALVRVSRGDEVDRVLGQACRELGAVGGRGGGAEELQGVVVDCLGRLAGFVGRVRRDVVARNPELGGRVVGAGRRGGRAASGGAKKVPGTTVNLTVRHKDGS